MDMPTGGLNEYQAAKVLGVSVHTLRAWRFRSRGPAYSRLGRRVTYALDDLENFRLANRVQPGRIA